MRLTKEKLLAVLQDAGGLTLPDMFLDGDGGGPQFPANQLLLHSGESTPPATVTGTPTYVMCIIFNFGPGTLKGAMQADVGAGPVDFNVIGNRGPGRGWIGFLDPPAAATITFKAADDSDDCIVSEWVWDSNRS